MLERAAPTGRPLAGKYLTFVLGRESYGIPVLKIREIIRMTDIAVVPRMPPAVRGVLNLRGKIIPVIDLRFKFNIPEPASNDGTCIIVVDILTHSNPAALFGLVVDAVEEVSTLAASDIEAPPDFGEQSRFILGIAKTKGRVKMLLDIDCALGSDLRSVQLPEPSAPAPLSA